MNIEKVKEAFKLIEQGMGMLSGGPLDYYIRRLTGSYDFLLTLSPFKMGELVQLADTPIINARDSWGWMPYKHFLVKGSVARVASIEADCDGFSYGLEFLEHSWINQHTKAVNPVPQKERGEFWFKQRWIEPHGHSANPQHTGE